MKLSSPAFQHNGQIPLKYTGEGDDVSPPLKWSGVPEGTREFVLLCEDPDAPGASQRGGPFVHWVIYDISPSTTQLPEGVPNKMRLELPIRADQGTNSFGSIGYGGPMPPVGHGRHHYFFRLYALNFELGVKPGASRAELLEAMHGHVLDQAELVGTYERVVSQVA